MAERARADKPPVFIVGAPRSGTTLLRNLLTRHPALAICGETRFGRDVYTRRLIFGTLRNPANRRRLVEQYLATRRIQQLGVDFDRLKEKLLREAISYPQLLASLLQAYADSQGKPRWGEKTPHHALYAETLAEWFPGAAIIHLVRDPREVVASLHEMPWAPSSVVTNAWLWRLFNRAARRSSHRPGYLLVHYKPWRPILGASCLEFASTWARSMCLRCCRHRNPKVSITRGPAAPVAQSSAPGGIRGATALPLPMLLWWNGSSSPTCPYMVTSPAAPHRLLPSC